jgi:site-specific recombinase XerD
MWDEQDPTWQEYLLYGSDSEATIMARRTALSRYLEFWNKKSKEKVSLKDIVELAKENDNSVEKVWLLCSKDMLKRLAPNTVKAYSGLIRSYLSWWGMHFSRRAKLPLTVTSAQERLVNKKLEYRPPDVKKLLDVITDLRDRALILMFFQGGIDISTTLSLKYGDVAEQLELDVSPIVIQAKRRKSQINFRFCIGSDAVHALKLYVDDRKLVRHVCPKCKGTWRMPRHNCPKCGVDTMKVREDIDFDEPLFIAHSGKTRVPTRQALETRMKMYVKNAKVVDPRRLERANFNIAGPHALRAAFSSILQYNGMNQVIIDGLQGHKVAYDSAYSRLSNRELIELYSKFEEHLTVSNAEEMMTMREELVHMKRQIAQLEARDLNRATTLAGAPSDPVKVVLYKKLLELIESDKGLLTDFEG